MNRPMEILLVEDNPGDVRLTIEVLKESQVHHNLNVVPDGREAVAYLQAKPPHTGVKKPDLILLDLNLPGISGQEVLGIIKNDHALRRIPVIVLTTSIAEQDVLLSYDLHANCYIAKPVDIEHFVEVIKVLEEFWFNIVSLPKE